MNKQVYILMFLFSTFVFAQRKTLEENIKSNPSLIEESFSKGIIKTNFIEGYLQEYYVKKYYDQKGNLTKIESFNDNGDLVSTEILQYDKDKLIATTLSTQKGDLIIIEDYEYLPNSYKVTKSENERVISVTDNILDINNNIIETLVVDFLNNENKTITKNRYNKNNDIEQKEVIFGNDGYFVNYKYDNTFLPIEEIITNKKGKIVSKKRRKYDENRNIIEEIIFDSNGKLKSNHKFIYEYDSNKNWIKRTQFTNNVEDPISNTVRTIRYN